MDGAAAHVQRRLGFLSQLLHRQNAVHVDDLIEMSANALELLGDVTPQRWGDFDMMSGDAELHKPPPVPERFTSAASPSGAARWRARSPSPHGTLRPCGVRPECPLPRGSRRCARRSGGPEGSLP